MTVKGYLDTGQKPAPDVKDTRPPYRLVADWLNQRDLDTLQRDQAIAERLFRRAGITFQVYTEKGDPERLIPFDIIPRIFTNQEWSHIEEGVRQRTTALNAFLLDIYADQKIIKDGIIPASMVVDNSAFEAHMTGFVPPHSIYNHITGTDIVRTGEDEFFVLEDNCRVPSGVSYMLETREAMVRLFPDLFESNSVSPIDHYTDDLHHIMRSVSPNDTSAPPSCAILTPGHFNSAYYEHSFLADEMGVPLVEGADLFVDDEQVFMRTTYGPEKLDVIYRRIDDAFLDPLTFNPDSLLGVPGLMAAYRAGNVTLVNAPGAGIADDKAIYSYLPEIIRYYLDSDPVLPNVETFRCVEPAALSHVLENLDKLVVKEVHGSGGYGMLIGPKASKAEIEAFRERLKASPAAYIAQPTLALSTCQTLVEEGIAPRHVDLRPFCLTGADGIRVCPGGLTRVALPKGSLVVNSSQGGGVKDTWILTADQGEV